MKKIQKLPSKNNETTEKKEPRNENEQRRESDNEETKTFPNELVNRSNPATGKTCDHHMRQILVQHGPFEYLIFIFLNINNRQFFAIH